MLTALQFGSFSVQELTRIRWKIFYGLESWTVSVSEGQNLQQLLFNSQSEAKPCLPLVIHSSSPFFHLLFFSLSEHSSSFFLTSQSPSSSLFTSLSLSLPPLSPSFVRQFELLGWREKWQRRRWEHCGNKRERGR